MVARNCRRRARWICGARQRARRSARNFSAHFEYSDCWVDDARLVVLNALDLKKRGGMVRLRTALSSARREADSWSVTLTDSATGSVASARVAALVNAAGPWVETVLRLAGGSAENRVRLVKGSHIIARKFWQGEQAYLLQNRDNRVIFVNPYEGDLCLIGTTDIPFDGAAEDARSLPTRSNTCSRRSIVISSPS